MAESGRIETVHLSNQEDKGEDIVNDDYDQKNEGEEVTLMQNRRPKLLSLEIPIRSLESSVRDFTKINIPSPISAKAGLPPRPASARLKSSVKNLLSQKSFRGKNPSDEAEKSVLMISDMSALDKPSTSKSFLNKLLSSAPIKSSNSVPVTPMSNADVSQLQENLVDHQSNELERTDVGRVMMRSLSVPVNVKSRTLRRADSSGVLMRVISIKQPTMGESSSSEICHETEVVMDDSGEDIPEEEAVCRICFVELGEGGETLKLECSCKGDLALAHKECAVKWFSIKGNKTCEVCKQDVRNLPVTLLKIQHPPNVVRRSSTGQQQREETHYRVWQDVPVLVLISMLAYFCFLEQLLVSDMGTRALAIALPFSCVLGLLSSMIASTMVDKRYIWAYASFQFAIVILFAHIFYTVLNVNAILSVLLSSFTGFGIVISTNSLISEYLRWRCSRYPQSNHTRHEARQHHHNHQNQRNQTNDNQQALNVARTRNEQHEATVQRL